MSNRQEAEQAYKASREALTSSFCEEIAIWLKDRCEEAAAQIARVPVQEEARWKMLIIAIQSIEEEIRDEMHHGDWLSEKSAGV